MKAKPYKESKDGYTPCEPSEATHVALQLPGPRAQRLIPVILRGSRDECGRTPIWSWNGDTEKPTLKPSILTKAAPEITDEEHASIMRGEAIAERELIVCHSWINDGRVQFLDDCTHEHKGQTMELQEVTWL